jgi:hypothetical protein
LEGRQALQRLPVGEADNLILAFEDKPFMSGAEPGDTRSHLVDCRDVDFPTGRCVLDVRAINRHTRSRILRGSRTHAAAAAARLHANSLAPQSARGN